MNPFPPHEIHVHTVPLNGSADTSVLSDEEVTRGERFRSPEHRCRYMNAHAGLRLILGRYLGVAASNVSFRRGPHGKPYINDSALQFNLSHSGNLALVAISFTEVGVDIEAARASFDPIALANRFLSAADAASLQALAEAERYDAFLRLWTRKEAALKAIGFGLGGLAMDLSGIPIHDIAPASGYFAAVAVIEPGPWTLALHPSEPC
jgi:4'-phosphopantetheinyl transferase